MQCHDIPCSALHLKVGASIATLYGVKVAANALGEEEGELQKLVQAAVIVHFYWLWKLPTHVPPQVKVHHLGAVLAHAAGNSSDIHAPRCSVNFDDAPGNVNVRRVNFINSGQLLGKGMNFLDVLAHIPELIGKVHTQVIFCAIIGKLAA